jgi:hypothetical protein
MAQVQEFSPEDVGKMPAFMVAFAVIFAVVWVGVGCTMTVFATAIAGPFGLAPILVMSLGLFGMYCAQRKYKTFRSAPILQHFALVVDERIHVSGGGKNSSASAANFTTLEFPDGRREEVQTHPVAAGQACPGDVGVAFLRANYLVHFGRIPV